MIPCKNMKTTQLLLYIFVPALAYTQESPPALAFRQEIRFLPAEVTAAAVQVEKIIKGGADGADLTIQVIAPPVFASAQPTTVSKVASLTPEARAARRAKAPLEYRMFNPLITVYANGISYIQWWVMDAERGYQDYAAWSMLNLGDAGSCKALEVGRRHYHMMAIPQPASLRLVSQQKAPNAELFKGTNGFIVVKGDASNTEAMEPVITLHEKYAKEADKFAADAAALKVAQKEAQAWIKAHPPVPQDTVIKMWPIQSTQYPTAAQPSTSTK
jgi:hypothetical protein